MKMAPLAANPNELVSLPHQTSTRRMFCLDVLYILRFVLCCDWGAKDDETLLLLGEVPIAQPKDRCVRRLVHILILPELGQCSFRGAAAADRCRS